MRHRLLPWCGLLLGLAAYAAATPAIAAGPADGPGCLGVPLADCLGWLRTTMKLDESSLRSALAERHATDVNGRPLGGGLVTVTATLRSGAAGTGDTFVLLLRLSGDDTVRGVDSNLLHGLRESRTEAVSDSSGLYEIAWRVIGRRCPGMTRIELYRFFENTVKPRITHQRQDLSTGINGLHRILSQSGAVPFCGGVTVSYASRLQWRGGQNLEAAAKRDEFAYIELR